MLLMIDNYDSFTYNLVQYFQRLDQEVVVKRNDEISLSQIAQLNPNHIVVSPGPCTPNEAGVSLAAIDKFKGVKPILGICLGHQSIVQVFGGNVIKAKQVMHGKTSKIVHTNQGVFNNLPQPLTVCRYHSLVAEQTALPQELIMTAWSENERGEIDEIMGVKHNAMPIEGVQFHPEAILTECGIELLDNFIKSYS